MHLHGEVDLLDEAVKMHHDKAVMDVTTVKTIVSTTVTTVGAAMRMGNALQCNYSDVRNLSNFDFNQEALKSDMLGRGRI